jgi:predicted pyridoxine 5'-phosphate oxidase superfamily flavin-nucleotide-binding protein
MVKMPDEVIKMFDNPDCDKQKALTWVATTTEEGEPHLMPACFVKPIGDDKLLIGIAFATQTIMNIKLGSLVTVANATYPNGYMIKGKGDISFEGPHFEDYKSRIDKRFGGKIKPKGALLVNVEKIYHLKPSNDKKQIA